MKLSFFASLAILATAQVLPTIKYFVISEEEAKIFNAFTDRSTYRCGKLIRLIDPGAISCDISEHSNSSNGSILLVGNSHADSIKTVFAAVASKNQVGTRFIVPNNPLMSGGISPEAVVEEAEAQGIKAIVVHFSPQSMKFENFEALVELAKEQQIKVSFIDPVPVWKEHIPKQMYTNLIDSSDKLMQTRDEYMQFNSNLFLRLNEVDKTSFKRYSLVDYFCKINCIYENDGVPLYFDEGHLTISGAEILRELFEKVIIDNS